MKHVINNRYTQSEMFSGEADSIKDFVVGLVKSGANLRDADLRGANLRGADLRGADLRDADLRDAYLRGADLRDAYLRGADLRGADLRDADLRDAYLRGADLRGADLRGAYLSGAYLSGAYLRGAYYKGIKIKRLFVLAGLYKYTVLAIVAEDGTWHIALGCKFQSVKEWESNFWNNTNEFPDDGSIETQERQFALRVAIECLKLHAEDEK